MKVDETTRAPCLHSNRFDHLHIFSGECELFSVKVVFHMLRARRASQRKHPNLHGKPKHNLREAGP